jgi:hypothetical protein
MRYKKQRELMNKMGVTGAVVLQDDEEDIRLSNIVNGETGILFYYLFYLFFIIN